MLLPLGVAAVVGRLVPSNSRDTLLGIVPCLLNFLLSAERAGRSLRCALQKRRYGYGSIRGKGTACHRSRFVKEESCRPRRPCPVGRPYACVSVLPMPVCPDRQLVGLD